MCGPYFNLTAADVSEYHVHIYFEENDNVLSRMEAQHLAWAVLNAFPQTATGGDPVGIVGPHTRPNIELDVKPEGFADVVRFLQLNSQGLSILIHPRTGDETFDHKRAALWLGTPVPLNEAFFERLQAREVAQRQQGFKPPRF